MFTVGQQVTQRDITRNKERAFSSKSGKKVKRCLACGNEDLKPGRRYCSRYCRQKLMWSLSLSKGLLQTLNARYAAFSFNDAYVALDILPAWSNNISRFVCERKSGNPPAHALKELILETGKQWYQKRDRRFSRSFASQSILEEKVENSINPESIKPNANRIPRLSIDQKKGLRIARSVTLVTGILALFVALKPPAAILWIVTMSFSLMASAFTFPFLLGLWWPRATKQAGIAGMMGGAVSCVVWYILGYMKYQSFDNWIWGIWPAIFGAMISLVLVITVSKVTHHPPQEVMEIFFDDILIKDERK